MPDGYPRNYPYPYPDSYPQLIPTIWVTLVQGSPQRGMSEVFILKVKLWVERNERKATLNFAKALYPIADVFDLLFTCDPDNEVIKAIAKKVANAILDRFLKSISKAMPFVEGFRKLAEKLFTKVQEQTEKGEKIEKRKLIDRYRSFEVTLYTKLVRDIRAQAGTWFKQVDTANDKAAEEAKITPLLGENSDLEVEVAPLSIHLSNIMKYYWGIQSPEAEFLVPAMQPREAISPLEPIAICNWKDIFKAIKAGDQYWTTIMGRPIVIYLGTRQNRETYYPEGKGRAAVEKFLIDKKKLLEYSL